MYKYLHDATARIVYQLPSEPIIIEQKDRYGKRTGWSADIEIRITRADNKLNNSQWQHATSSNPNQYFDAHYHRAQVVSYFLMHHTPIGEDITQEQYTELQNEYEKLARKQ